MPKPPLPPDVVDKLRGPNPAVMATVTPTGAPVSVATWYLWDDDERRVLLNLDATRKRLDHLRKEPRVGLTVLDGENWYHHVSLRGTVDLVDDTDLADIDRLAVHYTGQPYANRTSPRVTAWMTVTGYHVWPS
ncbi:TIGR03618 family F420-dependent PPOX class oxidoreductase [Isoptericola variabilis]|uniref:Putative F420-dependent enzyme n=1 Tax=Isoptericola variabilis (strain 225) TaxID=743718 RepID=F6FS46_ISOV2|nr:TIGR03618 family F420-dependent PPOX class oxidoreductase [Isoptericola variabilis]AEG45143.1 putative F420-dependent enzyme [Isoptericola variabilis 225]TWH31435.1 PPOX class probable F420-dependent enzyme [Isoptericola variabilis J7]